MATAMYERFNVKSLYIAGTDSTAFVSSGRTTGLVIDVGDGVTYTAPVFDGFGISQAVHRLDFAGRALTELLVAKLRENRGYLFTSASDFELVREMKEKMSYAEEHVGLAQPHPDTSYELPDGQVITIGKECGECIEPLFCPSKLGLELPGIHRMCYNSIQKCGMDVRRPLYSSITLCGGGTMSAGFQERMQAEMQALVPDTIKIKVYAPGERKYSVWIGGSILTSLSTFRSMWITREQYEDAGPAIIHNRASGGGS